MMSEDSFFVSSRAKERGVYLVISAVSVVSSTIILSNLGKESLFGTRVLRLKDCGLFFPWEFRSRKISSRVVSNCVKFKVSRLN